MNVNRLHFVFQTATMPAPGLPAAPRARARKRRQQPPKIANVAHELESKQRTEDVMTEENRDKDFASLMLSEPVLKGLK